ncbi:DUF6875 domain-containing protein [Streptomyces sp. NPDC003042]
MASALPDPPLPIDPPVPIALAAGPEELARTALGPVFQPYLRDYIGDSVGRAGPSAAICPFVRRALESRAMYYTEVRVEATTPPLDVARVLIRHLVWFDGVSRAPADQHPGLVVAFPGPAEPLLPVLAAAHRSVRAAVLARGCTSGLFHADPPDPQDARHPEPGYFTAPAPFYVLRRIIPADLQLALRVPGMFPAYHRLHAPEARRTRLRTSEAERRWRRACEEHGLEP